MFLDQEAREEIRRITAEALQTYFTIDPTGMSVLRIRLSKRPPYDVAEEQGLDPRARAFHKQARPIETYSDGVKAFVGIASALMSADYKVFLIDEPEAFLHPPLARKLGEVLSQAALRRGTKVLASTHSADFLMGCVQAGYPVNVIRLTYLNDVASARMLAGNELQTLMRDPLLRSTGVLSALFYQGAVICEADRDRAFYEEINRRLRSVGQDADDVLFTNAQNKQTIGRIIRPLRTMGIPAAAIVDLDILKEGDLAALMRAANVQEPLIQAWSTLKKPILDEYKAKNLDLKECGLAGLDETTRSVAKNLLANLEGYGIFVVPVGEVERWLINLGIQSHKQGWLVAMFERMGANPEDIDYVHADKEDKAEVWAFIGRVANWIANPNRKGIPT